MDFKNKFINYDKVEKQLNIQTDFRYTVPLKYRDTYRNVLGGLYKSCRTNDEVKFATFTTSDECVNQQDYNSRSLTADFITLKKRLNRITIKELCKNGYLDKHNYKKVLPNFNYNDKPYKILDYFKVQTKEGNGVLHSLLRCPFIPLAFLKDSWFDIHLSWAINIQQMPFNEYAIEDIAKYLIAQYIAGQGSAYLQSSMSKNWIFPHINEYWNYHIKKKYFVDKENYYFSHNRWINPYKTGNEFKKSFEQAIIEFYQTIDKQIEGQFEYKTKKIYNKKNNLLEEPYKVPKLKVITDECYDVDISKLNSEIETEKPIKTNVINDLTDEEWDDHELDVLNTLYKTSRVNPNVVMNPKKPNYYCEFVEKRLTKIKDENTIKKYDDGLRYTKYKKLPIEQQTVEDWYCEQGCIE